MKTMTLPLDTTTTDYRFRKTLNEDVQLVSNIYGKYDLNMADDDYINVTGNKSLYNAIVIAILTRYNELKNPIYENFGCKVHDRIKANKNRFQTYKIELNITETLEKMRRIQTVNELRLEETGSDDYTVYFKVTSINDETISGKATI